MFSAKSVFKIMLAVLKRAKERNASIDDIIKAVEEYRDIYFNN